MKASTEKRGKGAGKEGVTPPVEHQHERDKEAPTMTDSKTPKEELRSVRQQIQQNFASFKEVLRQEIEYYRASGEFDDLEENEIFIGKLMDFIDHFMKKDIEKVLDGLTEKLRKQIDEFQEENDKRLRAINEDQQLLDSQAQVILRSSYFISGYIQGLKEILGCLR